ncbi:Cytochrome c556 [Pseudomonas pohangensis]|uniref:Cytochrome c556 n=1 Tax=Pseudomonas pohangensis TaxID=364197 RepID=A0A1H2HGT2_9PSED|nr:cytochrome c [Pseudomonas pohangensis]SDU31090.1 Cytochrome c556 [Pseudomonas pohangensis]
MTIRPLLLCCTVLLLAGCGGVDPNSPMGKRQAIFKQMLKTSENLGGMLRGRVRFDEQDFRAQAQQLEQLSRQPWQHFPAVRDEGDTAAKAEVWQRQERFQELANALQARTGELAQASQAQPLTPAAVKPAQARVEAACKACHQEFRSH